MLSALPLVLPVWPGRGLTAVEVVTRLRRHLSSTFLTSAIELALSDLCRTAPTVITRSGGLHYAASGAPPPKAPASEGVPTSQPTVSRPAFMLPPTPPGEPYPSLYTEICAALRASLPTSRAHAVPRDDVLGELYRLFPDAHQQTLKGYLAKAASKEREIVRTAEGGFFLNRADAPARDSVSAQRTRLNSVEAAVGGPALLVREPHETPSQVPPGSQLLQLEIERLLSEEQREALALLREIGTARTTELARALKRSPVRVSGFMRRLKHSLYAQGHRVIRDEPLAGGEILYRYIGAGDRR